VARGEIIILSDANTMVDPQAVRKLVRHFEDPEVGAVCGRLMLYNRTRREYEESAYWAYESLIKLYEGKLGAVVGVNGGLYAIRRCLFTALPPGTIVDDLVIALRILENGYQVRYDPEAVAHEETTEDYDGEFGRRARIAAGNFQSLRVVPGLLSPAAGFRAFAFWSHKVLRWCAPALMAVALAANCVLARAPMYRVLLAAQVLFYGLAAAGRAEWFGGALRRVASAAYYFVKMNAAIAVGFWRFVRGSQAPAWERTARA
jgi:cellulose synthase/poly-beta-1,6-N-acetylglucosamine synthase-like glycosyltransferase